MEINVTIPRVNFVHYMHTYVPVCPSLGLPRGKGQLESHSEGPVDQSGHRRHGRVCLTRWGKAAWDTGPGGQLDSGVREDKGVVEGTLRFESRECKWYQWLLRSQQAASVCWGR